MPRKPPSSNPRGAPKGNKRALGNKGGGRPSKYKPEYAAQAGHLCRLGATDEDLADFFKVGLRAIARWKLAHSEFSASLKAWKESADERVEQSLYRRAMGYTHTETDIRVVNNEIVKTEIVKHYPPDATSMIFWLKNRKKSDWRDRHNDEFTASASTAGDGSVTLKIISGLERSPDE